jgi:mRNA interferase HigB
VIASGSKLRADYRLVASFDFRRQIVFVKFLGTHSEYDRVDVLTVSQF